MLQWIGIPTCVGFGRTKTLAKLANHVAKTVERKPDAYPERFAGLARVCDLGALAPAELDALFAATPVGEVWGIGRRISRQLEAEGVRTVLDLVRLDPAMVRARFSVVVERTVRELQGMPCVTLDDQPAPRQQVMVSRSFGQAVTSGRDLASALTEFVARAAEKLRQQGSRAGAVLVFIQSSPFRTQDRQYSRSITVPLPESAADTAVLLRHALMGLRTIFKRDIRYAKAGVMLVDLQPEAVVQGTLDLFGGEEPPAPPRARENLMKAVDRLNQRYGKGSILLASAGLEGQRRPWVMRQERRTPRYTTRWEEMPILRA